MKVFRTNLIVLSVSLFCLFSVFSQEATAKKKLRIIKARYGVQGNYRDVTERVQRYVRGDSINMQVTNRSLGGDPVHGQPKELKVVYKKDGQQHKVRIHEGDWFKISGSSGDTAGSHAWYNITEIHVKGKNAREISVNRKVSSVRITCVNGNVIINTFVVREGGKKTPHRVASHLYENDSRTLKIGHNVDVSGFRISEDGHGRYRVEVKQ